MPLRVLSAISVLKMAVSRVGGGMTAAITPSGSGDLRGAVRLVPLDDAAGFKLAAGVVDYSEAKWF